MPSRSPAARSRPTRERILRKLRLRPATVDELARHFGLTANAVRFQLATLCGDGLVCDAGLRRDGLPGQPAHIYAATTEAEAQYSTAYPPAFAALTGTLASKLPMAHRLEIFRATGKLIAEQIAAAPAGSAVDRAQDVLEGLGAAVTRRRSGEVAIVEGASCPLAEAVRVCPESCEIVRALLVHSIGAPVAMRCDHGAAPRCRFEVG